jgi:NADH-quinone oxidoreductase subunit G
MFDAERCISCSRCIRFCSDVIGDPQLTFVQRGDRVTVATFPGKQLDTPYSMNVIDVCPVGALTNKDFRFKARSWDMSSTPGICSGCARGCNTNIWVRQNEILRLTPRENQEVNNFWMCDHGRLDSWREVGADTRVRQPLLRRDGALKPVTWDEAVASVVSELKSYPKQQVAVIGSAFDTCEDNFALQRFAREVLQTPWIDLLPHTVPGDQDHFLVREDKTPNTAGARLAGLAPQDSSHGLAAIIEGIERGAIKAVVITDHRAAEHGALLAALPKAAYVLAIVSNTSALTDRADAVLASSSFAEKGGTWVNFARQIQLLHPAVLTLERERWMGGYQLSRLDAFGTEFDRWGRSVRADARPTWKVAAHLARILGAKWKYEHTEDVFDDMTQKLPALHGATYESIGRWGLALDGAAPAHAYPYVYSDVHPSSGH